MFPLRIDGIFNTRPVSIIVADIQEKVSGIKSWTAPGPDLSHAYWLKKLTALPERLAAQMNQLLVPLANRKLDSPDPQGTPEGTCPIQLQANNLPQYHMEAPVRHHRG